MPTSVEELAKIRTEPYDDVDPDDGWVETRSCQRQWVEYVLLCLCNIAWTIDASILPIFFKQFQLTFGVSQTSLSLLSTAKGLAAALFAFPCGFAAELLPRPRLISMGMIFWSLGLGFCAVAVTFEMIVVGRVFNGIGLGVVQPLLLSIVADKNRPTRRGSAFGSIYFVGAVCNTIFTLVATRYSASYVGEVPGWRVSVAAVAVFSALVGFLIPLLVIEPNANSVLERRKGQTFLSVFAPGPPRAAPIPCRRRRAAPPRARPAMPPAPPARDESQPRRPPPRELARMSPTSKEAAPRKGAASPQEEPRRPQNRSTPEPHRPANAAQAASSRDPNPPQASEELLELREQVRRQELKIEKLERKKLELKDALTEALNKAPAAAPAAAPSAPKFSTEEVAKRADMDVTEELKRQRRSSGQWDKTFGPKVFQGIWDGGRWTSQASESQKEQCVAKLLRIFKDAISEMTERLVERDEASRLLLLAVVAKANILLFGPPGTAKSAVCRLLANFIYDTAPDSGNCYFEAQFHQSTTVEDIFGAMSLTHLQQGRLKRNVESMLPYASVAFLDEAFKAQASLLSCLLSTLNERCFKNGDQMLVNLPLWTTVVASNEVPLEAGAGALFDRLLLRTFVGYVTEENQCNILNSKFKASDGPENPIAQQFSLEDIAALNKWAKDKLRYPAAPGLADAARGKWHRRLKHLFLLQTQEQANKLVQYLSDSGGQVKVGTAIAVPQGKLEGSDFLYQKLDEGLVLEEGWSSAGGGKVYQSMSAFTSDIANKSGFPKVLGFTGGLEEVGAYNLIKEFLEHVRTADEEAEKVQSNKRQSVEGGGRLSDRRFKQIGDLLRLVASSNFDASGKPRTWIIVPDLYIMVYCCWKTKKDWDEISGWWMQRLKQELRSMERADREGHHPENPQHMWLPRLVTRELVGAFSESGISEDMATAYTSQIRAKAKAREEERHAAFEIEKQERQEAEDRRDQEMRFQAEIEEKEREEEFRELRRKNEQAARQEAAQQRIMDEKLKASKDAEERIRKQAENLKKMEQAEKAQEKLREKAEEQEAALMQRRLEEQRVQEGYLKRQAEKLVKTKEASEMIDKEETPDNVKAFQTLISQNADINVGTRSCGDSPFTWAVYKGKTEFVKAMIMASPNPKTSYVDSMGDPPLCQVCRHQKGGIAMVAALLSLKCSVNDPNRKAGGDREGWLPIHYAAQKGDRDLAQAICDHDNSCLDKRTKDGKLPSEIAASDSFKTHLSNLR